MSDQLLLDLPVLEHEGPRAKRGLVEVAVLLDPGLADDESPEPAQGREEAGEGLLRDELDRVAAGGLDLVHGDEVRLSRRLLEQPVERELDVGGGQLLAVVELHALPELEGPRRAILADLPRFGQLGHGVHVAVEADELAVHHGRAPAPRQRGHQLRVEARRLRGLRRDERRRPAWAPAPTPAGPADRAPSVTPATFSSCLRVKPAGLECSRSVVIGRSSSGSSLLRVGVKHVTKAVSEQVEREHRHHDGDARENRDPRRGLEIGAPLVQHVAPRRRRRLRRESQVAQRGLDQYGLREGDRALDDEGREHVGQHVLERHGQPGGAERADGLDVVLLALGQDGAPHDAHEQRGVDDGDGEHGAVHPGPAHGGDADGEEQAREC